LVASVSQVMPKILYRYSKCINNNIRIMYEYNRYEPYILSTSYMAPWYLNRGFFAALDRRPLYSAHAIKKKPVLTHSADNAQLLRNRTPLAAHLNNGTSDGITIFFHWKLWLQFTSDKTAHRMVLQYWHLL